MAEHHDDELPHPWGFWLIVTLTILYLGWRLVEGIIWLFGRFG